MTTTSPRRWSRWTNPRHREGPSRPLRLETLEELEQREDPRLPARQGEVRDDVAGEGDHGDAVEVGEGDIGQRRRDLPGKVELRRIAERHAREQSSRK